MPYTIIQAGTALELYDPSGNHGVVTLPTNIVLSASRVPRFAIFGRSVVMVNSPNRPITIDGNAVARVLSPRPPYSIPTLSAQAGGALTGTYLVKQTFLIKDSLGNILAESEMGPVSNSQAVAAQWLRAANLSLSPDAVSATRLYRTTTGGSTYFPWIDLDGNTQTSIQDDLSDAGLGAIAAPALGTVPDLTLIAEFRGRLWGVDRNLVDDLRYSEAGKMWAWPAANSIPIPKLGSDSRGITALMARKEALGIGRRNVIQMIAGNSASNFAPVKVTENAGIESQESVAVYLDTAYFLWKDGVYAWGEGNQLKCISDGTGKGGVRSWFTTDSYFNRAKFSIAFGFVDPDEKKYKLFLCSAGSSTIDRWVEYDIIEQKWWGPHKTAAFTPTATLILPNSNDVLQPMVGGSAGFLWQKSTTRTDNTSTAIDFDVDTKRHDCGSPDVDKVFSRTTVHGVAQASGHLAVTPSVGELNAAASSQALDVDLTLNRQVIGRLGTGKTAGLNFRENTAGQDVILTGYEIEFSELGKR